MFTTNRYDLKSVKLPRLAGGILSLFTYIADNPLTKGFLLGNLLKTGGITGFRQLVIDDSPTFQPDPPRYSRPDTQTKERADLQPALHPGSSQPAGFRFASSMDYASAYLQGHTTPEEVAESVIAAISDCESRDPAMHIFIAWQREEIMAQARAATQRHQEAKSLGPLDGVPVAVKDELDMLPYPTTVGTRFLGSTPAMEDATPVARLRAAGALLLGKTNMHEIGIGVTGLNPHYGTVRNPYNPKHHTGGSSSGPAAAVAAGLCPLALGADGGGSIRLPASFCGVVGLKPTYSRVSKFGAASLTWSMGHVGPIAATAQDAALGYAIMSGPDPRDPHTLSQPPLSLHDFDRQDLSDLTLGVYWPWFRHAQPQVVSTCEQMLEKLQTMGASIHEVELPELEATRVAHLITITSEMATALDRYHEAHHKEYSLEVRLNLALARSFSNRDYVKAQQVRTRTIAHFEQAFEKVDAIVTPASAVTAPPIKFDAQPDGESDLTVLTEIMRYAFPSNLTGHPAISFPAGYDQAGMPVGMQVIAGYWQEHLLLRLAHAAESNLSRKPPLVHYRLLPE
ncbi:MAG TPA: amidase [Anaerolineales bacterium]|nr:amidase [Anaerolineales bacterium]